MGHTGRKWDLCREKRIKQIMRELSLNSIWENAKSGCRSRQEYLKRNLLNQEFSVKRPNEVLVSDITYFKIRNYTIYLCVIVDPFFHMVVGYRVSHKCSTHLVTATFKDAFRVRDNPAELTFHSDRGGQYTSDTFFCILFSFSKIYGRLSFQKASYFNGYRAKRSRLSIKKFEKRLRFSF